MELTAASGIISRHAATRPSSCMSSGLACCTSVSLPSASCWKGLRRNPRRGSPVVKMPATLLRLPPGVVLAASEGSRGTELASLRPLQCSSSRSSLSSSGKGLGFRADRRGLTANARQRQQAEAAAEATTFSTAAEGSENAELKNWEQGLGTKNSIAVAGEGIRDEGVSGDGDGKGVGGQSRFWEWRKNWVVHYEVAGDLEDETKPAVLLLPGFGVGAFHFHHQLQGLSADHRIWALDFFGQGRSWPSRDPAPRKDAEAERQKPTGGAENGEGGGGVSEGGLELSNPWDWGFGNEPEEWAQDLVYSAEMWTDQVEAFVREVIRAPVFVVGNSLGGFIGTNFSARCPTLVSGLCLLNATPFWAFMPNPDRNPNLTKLLPWLWSGQLPVPTLARGLARRWWDDLRRPDTIRSLLALVYADPSPLSPQLVAKIKTPTDHPAAAAAFASILFSPKSRRSFDENMESLRKLNLPVCLIYGRDDPWVVPLWGQRVKRQLASAVYYELSPSGHCPHHETPEVVNHLLAAWIASSSSPDKASEILPLHKAQEDRNRILPLAQLPWRETVWIQGQGLLEPEQTASVARIMGSEDGQQKRVIVRLKSGSPASPVDFLDAAFTTVIGTLQGLLQPKKF